MKVQYSIITPSKMEVLVDERKLIVTGEGTTEARFYADKNSIKNWAPPYDNIAVTEEEKTELIRILEEQSRQKTISVIFE